MGIWVCVDWVLGVFSNYDLVLFIQIYGRKVFVMVFDVFFVVNLFLLGISECGLSLSLFVFRQSLGFLKLLDYEFYFYVRGVNIMVIMQIYWVCVRVKGKYYVLVFLRVDIFKVYIQVFDFNILIVLKDF